MHTRAAASVMGVINVTPDSFVPEVRTLDPDLAVARAHQLVAEGATIIDIGGESTRPGADPVPLDDELVRVIPVIERLSSQLPETVRISVDTRYEDVARAAVDAGAHMINDMSASLGPVAGELGVEYVAGHMQGEPGTMQTDPHYESVVDDVFEFVTSVAREAVGAGAPRVWIDPGIGFGKTLDHNLELLADIDRFVDSEFDVLIGVSRKSVIGSLHGASDARVSLADAEPTSIEDRQEASLAIAVWAATLGVDIVRVHDVSPTVQALKVVATGNRL